MLEIETGNFQDTQTVERGARGKRFFNVTRALAAGAQGQELRLRGRHLSWRNGTARLHVCPKPLSGNSRVVVVAPHPDDAELAAFGLYTSTSATVVTVTAGDGSDRYRADGQPLASLQRGTVARMRVWDSIAVPQLGGTPPDKAINLCYPDGQLSRMQDHPDTDTRQLDPDAGEVFALRRLNRSPLIRNCEQCTWRALVEDLTYIFALIRPDIIVTPHPVLDPHADHRASTAAVFEAVRAAGLERGSYLFSCVHNSRNTMWPYGPAGTGAAYLPIFTSDGVMASGYYSHTLSPSQQTDKYIALEAMHDLRDMNRLEKPSLRRAAGCLRTGLRILIDGDDRARSDHFRRAVRPDEVFFVAPFGTVDG